MEGEKFARPQEREAHALNPTFPQYLGADARQLHCHILPLDLNPCVLVLGMDGCLSLLFLEKMAVTGGDSGAALFTWIALSTHS